MRQESGDWPDLYERDGPRRSDPEQQRAGADDASTAAMSRVLESQERVHVDERQMQTGAVAEEQVARDPQLARLVREPERT